MLQLFSRQWDNNLRERSLHTSCVCTDNVCISNCSHLRTLSLLKLAIARLCYWKVCHCSSRIDTPDQKWTNICCLKTLRQLYLEAQSLNLLLATWLLAQFSSQALIWIILSPYKSKSLAIILILMINATELTFDDQKLWCTMKCM